MKRRSQSPQAERCQKERNPSDCHSCVGVTYVLLPVTNGEEEPHCEHCDKKHCDTDYAGNSQRRNPVFVRTYCQDGAPTQSTGNKRNRQHHSGRKHPEKDFMSAQG
jgi:hypothetical protein